MPINFTALNARAKDFNDRYHTNFDYEKFCGKLRTFEQLVSEDTADVAYKGTLSTILKDIMIIACDMERTAQDGKNNGVDLLGAVKDFEEYLMQPFVKECKRAGETVYPRSYGGMTEAQRIELVEYILNASPKNDVELTEQAYKSGKIRLRDMRELVNDMPFAIGRDVDRQQVQRIAAFMLAIENINKSRPLWWRVIHPFRNHAEKRDAREYRTVLNSFGNNALNIGTDLAKKEYKTLELTKESINNIKAEIEREKNKTESQKHNEWIKAMGGEVYEGEGEEQVVTVTYNNQPQNANVRDSIKVNLADDGRSEVSQKIDEEKIDQPVIGKNV